MQPHERRTICIAIGGGVVLIAVLGVMSTFRSSGTRGSGGCTEFDHHDRRLPNSFRLRVLEHCAYRIKWGPDHMILPTTGGPYSTHGILEVAILGNTVVGPIVDMGTTDHAIIGWFWLNTSTRDFKEQLSKDEVIASLKSKGLALPDVLTPVNTLPGIAFGG